MRSVRWTIAILVTLIVAVGYLDRQTLAVAIKAIESDIAISDRDFGILQAMFFGAYACMFVGGGKLMDSLGARWGFLLIVVWWSLACAAHGLADGFAMLAAGRLMLGFAMGGTFPAGAKAFAEWFPSRERSTAMGMLNVGSSIGAVIAPPAIALILTYAPWPWVFYLSGALGLPCAALWLWVYRPPAQYPRLSAKERSEIQEVLVSTPHQESAVPWQRLFTFRQV
jgi:ACS family hexuronate transporter-like MFS transporter